MLKPETTLRTRFGTLAMFRSAKKVSKPTLKMSCMFPPSRRIWSRSVKLLSKGCKFDSHSDNTSSSTKRDTHSSPFPLFYSPRREGRYNRLHHLYILSFQTEICLNFLARDCVLSNTFTPADLRLNMYNTSKRVPSCKGRFTHIVHGFRLGTVFSTTPPLSRRVHHLIMS